MIGGLLPESVRSHEVFGNVAGEPLFPEEAAAVAGAVDKRVSEFTTVRHCARRALVALGRPVAPLVPGARGEPQWPAGVVGSMTHCTGYRAAAVASAQEVTAIGIDAEENAPLPPGVLDIVARPEERAALANWARIETTTHWDRLLFSAKEAVYKAWYPLTGAWLDFEQVNVRIDPSGHFVAELVLQERLVSSVFAKFFGRWTVQHELITTAIAVLRP